MNDLTGLGILFGKLQQGVMENRQILTIARLRAEAEETYGQRLAEIVPSADKISGGFSRDDGATVRKVSAEGTRSSLGKVRRRTAATNSLTADCLLLLRPMTVCVPKCRMPRVATSESPKAFVTW